MKPGYIGFVTLCFVSWAVSSRAATLCVNLNSKNPVSPYTSWSSAATNIQDAIDASTNGDLILVTNGVYTVGGKSMDGVITNRVSLDKDITVQSVNGPFVTIIQGAGMSNGVSAVRCAWLTNNAALVGFTLEGGATRVVHSDSGRGGGAWCASSNALVANCVVAFNRAFELGGGAYQGMLKNCLIASNTVDFGHGGGAGNAALNNCTVVGNFRTGIYQSAPNSVHATNCIIYFNEGGDYAAGAAAYCCTTLLPSGPGNFTNAPEFFADGIHLTSGSPCIEAGTNITSGTDIFGQSWANPPSIGCTEWQPTPQIMPPQIQPTGSPVGFTAGPVAVNGQPPFSFQWLKDGVPIQEDGHFSGSQTTNLIAASIKFSDAGSYQLVASNAFGMVTSAVAQLVMHFVDAASTNPQPPFTNWITAAANIQDAIDAAAAGDIVMVTNGVYATGGRVMPYSPTNRIVLDKALIVVSVNGYIATTIQGAWDPVSTNGPGAIRCAWLTNGAVLSGFSLEHGATGAGGIVSGSGDSGGGVYCASTNAAVSSTNAVVANCFLTNNSSIFGGGICGGTLNNSLVTGNLGLYGGGALNSVLNNCTVVNNHITTFSSGGAGTYNCAVRNSVVLDNTDNWPSPFGAMDNYYYGPSYMSAKYSYSCTYPLPSGTGNIDGMNTDPQFLDSFHIATTSPCHGAGNSFYANGTDLDGEPWANPPSMGCDEPVLSNLTGPLSVNILIPFYQTNTFVGRLAGFSGIVTGRVAYVTWSFGDGPTFTNFGTTSFHQWTNAGNYPITFTAFNFDHPAGATTNAIFPVLPLNVPQLQFSLLSSNGFQFQFAGQWNADYTIQYATNLVPPVTWRYLQSTYYNTDSLIQITDPASTNAARFYRVLAQ